MLPAPVLQNKSVMSGCTKTVFMQHKSTNLWFSVESDMQEAVVEVNR
jgi:hypothetical protein